MQFGCMLQRGHYPLAEDKLRGTFLISSAHDAVPGLQLNRHGAFEVLQSLLRLSVMFLHIATNQSPPFNVYIVFRHHKYILDIHRKMFTG